MRREATGDQMNSPPVPALPRASLNPKLNLGMEESEPIVIPFVGTENNEKSLVIILIYLITCYTKDNNPRLNTNATSHPYGRTTRKKTTNLTKRNTLVKLPGG